MKILVACEESQAVTIELRRLGHEAYSCDIEPCSGGHPEWHIQDDALRQLFGRRVIFLQDGSRKYIRGAWDMIIAFPPCTYLTVTGNKWFKPEYKDRFPTREQDRLNAAEFFMKFANADCPRIAIENPVGVMSTIYRKPDQIIQPWQFKHEESKKTCLWLKGLQPLRPTGIVEPVFKTYSANGKRDPSWHMDTMKLPPAERSKARSKTYPGIARAMAEQWAGQCNKEEPI